MYSRCEWKLMLAVSTLKHPSLVSTTCFNKADLGLALPSPPDSWGGPRIASAAPAPPKWRLKLSREPKKGLVKFQAHFSQTLISFPEEWALASASLWLLSEWSGRQLLIYSLIKIWLNNKSNCGCPCKKALCMEALSPLDSWLMAQQQVGRDTCCDHKWLLLPV